MAISASVALGEWMKNYCKDGATVHDIRHAFRDRLRAVGAPVDLIDQLGGWSVISVGPSYGSSFSLDFATKCLKETLISGE